MRLVKELAFFRFLFVFIEGQLWLERDPPHKHERREKILDLLLESSGGEMKSPLRAERRAA